MHADSHRGHAALRRGRVSIANQVYHVTTATLDRQPFFADFGTADRDRSGSGHFTITRYEPRKTLQR